MKKILLATPMMPPTPGGPSTHAKKLYDFFGEQSTLFNFEIYKSYPSGVRHMLTFFAFINPLSTYYFRKFDAIFALDGFTVALPAVIAGKLLNKKVILRIGGDFIYENFLYTKEVNIIEFYENFYVYKKQMSWGLYVKYLVQKYVLENCCGIIFNTDGWQEQIYKNHYKLPKNIWNISNPSPSPKGRGESVLSGVKKFVAITRDIPYKNISRIKKVCERLGVELETKQRSHDEVLKTLSNAYAYINASLSEISPNQVLEATRFQLPIIITKYSGITDYLVKSGVAITVEPTDQKDIEEKIKYLLDDNNYQKIKENYKNFKWSQTWDSMFLEYQKIVDMV